MDEVQRAIGLDFFPQASGPGQRTGGLNLGSVLLIGNPAIGEEYLHEFVHAVLGPSLPVGNRLLGEGVATWLGGSKGRSVREMYALLHRYQEADPALTLSGVISNGYENGNAERGTDLLYSTGALVANALYQKQGIAGIRRLYQLKGDADTLILALARELGLPATDKGSLDKWWRTEAARASSDN